MSFFDELKRRNVVRVGIAYAVGAWVLLQIFDVVDESLELPEWGGRLILALMAVAIAYLLFDKCYLSQHLEHIGPEAAQQAVSQPAAPTPPPEQSTAQAAIDRQSIAVLPFDNRSRLDEDEFFVEGIHDDLLTNLAQSETAANF